MKNELSIKKKLIILLLYILYINSCSIFEPIPESRGLGDYYIVNNTSSDLIVVLNGGEDYRQLLLIGEKRFFFSISDLSGGSVGPINSNPKIEVFLDMTLDTNVLVDINDDRWVSNEPEWKNDSYDYHLDYILTINDNDLTN